MSWMSVLVRILKRLSSTCSKAAVVVSLKDLALVRVIPIAQSHTIPAWQASGSTRQPRNSSLTPLSRLCLASLTNNKSIPTRTAALEFPPGQRFKWCLNPLFSSL